MLDLLRTRRSVRKFQKTALKPEQIEQLEEAVLRSPSSRGLEPWEFVFVRDRKTLKKLSRAKQHGAEFVADAALAIVVCADPTACDVWVEDCSIASFIAHLTAHSMGLGSCWVQLRLRKDDKDNESEAVVRGILALPDYVRVLSIVAIGAPAQKPRPIPTEKLHFKKIRIDHW